MLDKIAIRTKEQYKLSFLLNALIGFPCIILALFLLRITPYVNISGASLAASAVLALGAMIFDTGSIYHAWKKYDELSEMQKQEAYRKIRLRRRGFSLGLIGAMVFFFIFRAMAFAPESLIEFGLPCTLAAGIAAAELYYRIKRR